MCLSFTFSSMFTSDQSYPLTFSREQRQLWFSAIQQNLQQPRGCWIADISESWLCMEQLINSSPKSSNSAFQQFREYSNYFSSYNSNANKL